MIPALLLFFHSNKYDVTSYIPTPIQHMGTLTAAMTEKHAEWAAIYTVTQQHRLHPSVHYGTMLT